MSLLDRVQAGNAQPRDVQDRGRRLDAKNAVREKLYEHLTPERIAGMVAENPATARKDIAASIDRAIVEVVSGAMPQAERDALRVSLLNDILGLGPIEPMLNDPSITEIMVNGFDRIFFERAGTLYQWAGGFDDDEHVMRVIERIVAPLGRRVDERSPMVNARLPEGHRVNAIIPPLALNGPTLTIRKFRTKIFTLPELTRMGSLEPQMEKILGWAVRARENVAVTGGTGSGKTTLLNALSIEIPEHERIITVEDSAELRFQRHPHVVSLEARPANVEGEGEITIRDLVINCLRMRPDRIVVGECRGGEALDMLQAMNTGHDGSLTTLHANSPVEAVSRLVTMVRYAAELPVEAIREQIASAVGVFVHQDRMSDGSRRITKIVETDGIGAAGEVKFRELVRYVQEGVTEEGKVFGHYEYVQPGEYFDKALAWGIATKEEVAAWSSA